MRKPLSIILVMVLLATSAFAASNSFATANVIATPNQIVVCPTEAQLTSDLEACQKQGGTGSTYMDGNCKRVKCVNPKTGALIDLTAKPEAECPDVEAYIQKCKNSGLEYTTTPDANGCKKVECIYPETTCPSNAETERKCKAAGLDIEYYYNDRQCRIAQCVGKIESPCPTEDELQAAIQKCKENDMSYEIYNDAPTTAVAAVQDCMRVRCTEIESNCPSSEDMRARIEECKKKGMDYQVTIDNNQCKQIQCKYQPSTTIECKKVVQGNCIALYCTDGTNFNTCDMQQYCSQVECKRYKTDDGCTKTVCTDGSEKTTDCPESTSEVECSVITDKEGCKIKRCTNGEQYTSCPDNTGCKEYTDENNCKIRECPTHLEKQCPEDTQTPDFTCTVYTDQATGCVIRECTTGLRINYCTTEKGQTAAGAEIQCVESVTGDCKIKTCSSGYVLQNCNDGVVTECMVATTADGCRVMLCSDGTSIKIGCSESTQPMVLTNMPESSKKLMLGENRIKPQPEQPTGIWGWLRGLFGGKPNELSPQPDPPGKGISAYVSQLQECVKNQKKAGIDDEITWGKCENSIMALGADAGVKADIAKIRSCIDKANKGIDDDPTWMECTKGYLK